MSKVTEHLAAQQLTHYLQDNQLLPELQSAYRSDHSTETEALKVIFDAADDAPSEVTLLGMLDLSAAFDTVDHEILLARLHDIPMRMSIGCPGSLTSITSASLAQCVERWTSTPEARVQIRVSTQRIYSRAYTVLWHKEDSNMACVMHSSF